MKYQTKFVSLFICLVLILFFSSPLTNAMSKMLNDFRTLPLENGHVALTFDDGPSKFTPEILAILKHYNIKATFFIIGENAERYPGLVKEIQAEGHAIANHTMTHPMLTRVSDDRLQYEIGETSNILKHITGYAPVCLRPPYGDSNERVMDAAHALNMKVVMWSVNSHDYEKPGIARLEKYVLSKTQPNFIILLHDGGGDRSETVSALPVIIESLRQRGMQFDTICAPSSVNFASDNKAQTRNTAR